MQPKRIFFSVGEPSGDLHASNLILDFKASSSESEFDFFGFGGPKMAQAGCDLMEDLTQHAVMFLTGVLSKIIKFKRLLSQAEAVFSTQRVDLVVLIDYSGFNWHIAKRAKKHGIPVVFYGIPQMWAWAPWRVKKMRKFVDLGICKLPFEKQWLESRRCSAEYVGHPFFDEMQRQQFDSTFEKSFTDQQSGSDHPLVTILPGSRTQEIRHNLPVFLKTAQLIHKKQPDIRFAVSCLDHPQKELAESIRQSLAKNTSSMISQVPIFGGKTPELIRSAKCCLACSGSVSLELMYREKPTVIHYLLPAHLFLAQKVFLRTKYITLVNLLWTDSIQRQGTQVYDPDQKGAESVPFPEYMTNRDKSKEMAGQILELVNNPSHYAEKKKMLGILKQKYGKPGASQRAVQLLTNRFFSGTTEKPVNEAA
ncbi:MAG: lipid-A-disaccharide synthase [Planctomycetota bacterium]|nr:lipid-A-disaccharide synthase [Planctomycetota bacterium]